MKVYIQVGATVLRSPTGEFYPAIPLYIEVGESGMTCAEERILRGFSKLAVTEYGKRLQTQNGGRA